jgi:hypothetical protein
MKLNASFIGRTITDVAEHATEARNDVNSSVTMTASMRNKEPAKFLSSSDQLKKQISKANQLARDNRSIIPSDSIRGDDAGDENCIVSISELQKLSVTDKLGGGELFVDKVTAQSLKSLTFGADQISSETTAVRQWTDIQCERMRALRNILKQSIDIIRSTVPSLQSILTRIVEGYDLSTTYEAFCDGAVIVVNYACFVSKLSNILVQQALSDGGIENIVYPRTLLHEFIVVITHEIAHLLNAGGGHGQSWRDSHMSLLNEIYASFTVMSSENRFCTTCSCSSNSRKQKK